MSAPGADAAQSNAGTAPDGQGQDQDRSGSQQYSVLGEDAFNDAPEELRDHLVNYVKTKVDPALTQRFQEASEFRSTWEPFSQIEGLTNIAPEDVDQLVELHYTLAAASDPDHPQNQEAVEAFQETWEQLGQQLGYFDDEGEEGEEESEEGDDEPEYLTREEFEQMMSERQQQDQQKDLVEQTRQEIRGYVDNLELPGEQGTPERERAERAIFSFLQAYDDPKMSNEDAVKAAYQDFQELVGGAQEQLVEDTEDRHTGSTLRGGGADTSPEEVRSFKEADKLALARFKGA